MAEDRELKIVNAVTASVSIQDGDFYTLSSHQFQYKDCCIELLSFMHAFWWGRATLSGVTVSRQLFCRRNLNSQFVLR
jgi:hypothetical protein